MPSPKVLLWKKLVRRTSDWCAKLRPCLRAIRPPAAVLSATRTFPLTMKARAIVSIAPWNWPPPVNSGRPCRSASKSFSIFWRPMSLTGILNSAAAAICCAGPRLSRVRSCHKAGFAWSTSGKMWPPPWPPPARARFGSRLLKRCRNPRRGSSGSTRVRKFLRCGPSIFPTEPYGAAACLFISSPHITRYGPSARYRTSAN